VFSAVLDVVNHFDEHVIGGIDVGPDRVEFKAEWLEPRPVHVWQRHHRRVPAPLQFQRQRDQRIDIAERTDIRENDAQKSGP